MNGPARAPLRAVSPDGVWRFHDGKICSDHAVIAPFEIDFFERWTFARFLPGGQLVLAFESSQPWSDYGSYGDRYGGVEVLALTAPATWSLVAFEFDVRAFDETFVPDDVVWHPRGVLAWLHRDNLFIQILTAPRGIIPPDDLVPPRDSDCDLAFWCDVPGTWRTLSLDDDGTLLSATDDSGTDRFDLVHYRRARDGGPWRPLTD